MTVDRFGNSQDKRAEPRYPAPTAPARPRNRAREKEATTQTYRARVLEVRIHLPPGESHANFRSLSRLVSCIKRAVRTRGTAHLPSCSAANSAYRKQSTTWSLTIPVACIKA